MEEQLFDKNSADALLPQLRALIAQLQDVANSEAMAEAQKALHKIGGSNGSASAAEPLLEQASAMQETLQEIESMGVILRDPETGLCDFPAERDGEEIYLCWQLGESEVGWWHPRDTGIAGRQPL